MAFGYKKNSALDLWVRDLWLSVWDLAGLLNWEAEAGLSFEIKLNKTGF